VSLAYGETKYCELPGCIKPVAVNRRGGPAKFCSPAHKLRAFRARNRRDDVTVPRTSFPKKRKLDCVPGLRDSRRQIPYITPVNKTERPKTSFDYEAVPVPSFDPTPGELNKTTARYGGWPVPRKRGRV